MVVPVSVAVVVLLGVALLAGLAVRGWSWVRSRSRSEDPAVTLAREHGLDEGELERTRTAVRRGRQVEPALRPAAVAWAGHVLDEERSPFAGASWRARGVIVVVFLGLHLVVLAALVLGRGVYAGWAGSLGWASSLYLWTLGGGFLAEIVRRRLVRWQARRAILRNGPSDVERDA